MEYSPNYQRLTHTFPILSKDSKLLPQCHCNSITIGIVWQLARGDNFWTLNIYPILAIQSDIHVISQNRTYLVVLWTIGCYPWRIHNTRMALRAVRKENSKRCRQTHFYRHASGLVMLVCFMPEFLWWTKPVFPDLLWLLVHYHYLKFSIYIMLEYLDFSRQANSLRLFFVDPFNIEVNLLKNNECRYCSDGGPTGLCPV